MDRLIGRGMSYSFAGPLPAVWSAMADTARYNAAAALPRQTITEQVAPDGSVRFLAHAKMGPFTLEWEDLPCNWVRERWFHHRRQFSRGPLEVLDARFELTATSQGCRADYRVQAAPRGLLGRLILAGGFLRGAERMFTRLAAQADRFATGAQPLPFAAPAAPLLAHAAHHSGDSHPVGGATRPPRRPPGG